MEIVVIGESCIDNFIYGPCNRIAPEAPALVFNKVSQKSNPGMAMNTLLNLESLLKINNINTKPGIITNDNWKEISKTRYVEERTNSMLLRVDEGDDKVEHCDINKLFDSYPNAKAVIISDYCKGFLTESDISKIAVYYPITFLDTKKILGRWCNDITFIKLNTSEYNNTKHVFDLNPILAHNVIVTRGDKGCIYQNEEFHVPSVPMKDCVGAGDTFLAALTIKYLLNLDIIAAIKYANECATKVIQKRGVTYVEF